MDDLIDFPDGGRATLVRRLSPPLTSRDLSILRHCPYENPGRWVHTPLRARVLKSMGLLEENPCAAPGEFRVTEAGADVLRIWDAAGFKP